ncbi:MAG: NAD(+) synthase [Clostridia bacterium]|nr:NAD(+) synthase [Clostridia bacterium]
MFHGFLKVAAYTPKVRVGDCIFNAESIKREIDLARERGVAVLTLPELCVTAYTCGDLFVQDGMVERAMAALKDIVDYTRGSDMFVAVGCPVVHRHLLYNCGVIVQNGEVLALIPKQYLPNYAEFREKRWFQPCPEQNERAIIFGKEVPFGNKIIFRCDNWHELVIGVEVCADLWATMPPSSIQSQAGALLCLNLSASDEAVTKDDFRRLIVTCQSSKENLAYVYCSAGEGESTTDVVFSQHNIIAENGGLVTEAVPFGSGHCEAVIDVNALSFERRRHVKHGLTNPEVWEVPIHFNLRETNIKERNITPHPFLPEKREDWARRSKAILDIQCNGLKKRIEHVNPKRLIIGVSGGLDSTIAMMVCARTLRMMDRPVTDIYAVSLPCFGTSNTTKNNAEKLCAAMGVPLRTIDISEAVSVHLKNIEHTGEHDAAYENAQARERTQVLLNLANMEKGIMIGTGDLSEAALGFCTYGGDAVSMYSVNCDVPKTAIRMVLHEVAKHEGGELAKVLNSILDTPISPELLPGKDGVIAQRTEDLIGPYELHDFYLFYTVRYGMNKEKILRMANTAFEGSYTKEVIERWYDLFIKRFYAAQFKRSSAPDGPRVGNVCLSQRGDWCMASDAVAPK